MGWNFKGKMTQNNSKNPAHTAFSHSVFFIVKQSYFLLII